MGYRQVSYPEQVWYILRYFLMEGGKNKMPKKPKRPCSYPGCPELVRSMKSKRISATRNMTVTLPCAVVMVVLGSVSVTAMCSSILCASCAKRKVCLFLQKKSTTRSLSRKAAHMREII